jgi:hypothetical protein
VVVEDAGTPASREDGGGLVASRGEDLGHRLLRTASVSDVADRLGYGSPAFTAAFTRAFGMPPSRFTASGAGGGPGRGHRSCIPAAPGQTGRDGPSLLPAPRGRFHAARVMNGAVPRQATLESS